MAKALIFGANGQDGFYLARECQSHGIETIGVSRGGGWHHGDVRNFQEVSRLIKSHQPDFIFHLAARSSTRHDYLMENHETISGGSLHILESVKRYSPKSKVFLAGSGLQFVNSGEPISEKDHFYADNPYSVARIQSVYAARYFRKTGIKVYVGFLFHHESPLRKSCHVSKMIVNAAKDIAVGKRDYLELGDLSVEKEWTFAGDVAKAMLALISQDDIFEAVIGSGKAYNIQYWLELCFTHVNKQWQDHIKLMNDFTSDYQRLVSNPETMRLLGWKPSISIEKLCEIMMSS